MKNKTHVYCFIKSTDKNRNNIIIKNCQHYNVNVKIITLNY